MAPDLGVVVVQRALRERWYRVDATDGALARVTAQRVYRMTAYTWHRIVRGAYERIGVPVVVVVIQQHDRLPAHRRVLVFDRGACEQVVGKLPIRLLPETVDLVPR